MSSSILESGRIILRPFEWKDLDDVYEYLSDDLVTLYLNFPTYQNKEDAVEAMKLYYLDKPGVFAIELKNEKKCIGCVDLRFFSEHDKASFGFVLNRGYWNQGYMTDALRLILEYAFVEMKLNRVEATHYVGNEGSGRVMQKCGMKYEGTGMSEVKIKGVYRDVVHYAILKDEWVVRTLKSTASFFEDQEKFRTWLAENHEKETELLVGFYKVSSDKPSMTWSESVDQALCFGWIDSVRRSIDEESYCIRFTPRKKTSIWSTININKVEELKKLGLMKPAGLKAYSFKKDDKSEIYSFENGRLEFTEVYENQFRQDELAWEFFNQQAASYKKSVAHWIMSGKQEKTRQSRLRKVVDASREQRRLT